MAAALEVAVATLRNWERPRQLNARIPHRHIQRYQDLLGFPVCMTIAISQTLAAARDRRDDHLQVLAAMMRKHLQFIGTKAQRRVTIGRVTPKDKQPEDTTYDDWDNLIAAMLLAAWTAVPDELRNTFKNPERLLVHGERRAANRRRAAKRRRRRR